MIAFLASMVGLSMAGRRFSEEAEEFAVDLFKDINRQIEWSHNHYLAALSARFATCQGVGRRGALNSREIPYTANGGAAIYGLTDYVRSDLTDWESVTAKIEERLTDWMKNPTFTDEISKAKEFGCSAQPGCRGDLVICCLFTRDSFRDENNFGNNDNFRNRNNFNP
jgi:hypothetical protein